VISLGTVANEALAKQTAVLVAIALIMTVGVYGFVAGIVKLDDGGLALTRRADAFSRALGRAILAFAPLLMKLLTIVGTAAMFLVGGGILVHGVPLLAHAVDTAAASPGSLAGLGGVVKVLLVALGDMVVGVIAGAIVLGVVVAAKRVFARKKEAAATP
jgi:predicted DNA repair protein MutK